MEIYTIYYTTKNTEPMNYVTLKAKNAVDAINKLQRSLGYVRVYEVKIGNF